MRTPGYRFSLRRRRESVEDRALTAENLPGVMLRPTVAGPSITADSALRIVDVLAAVRLLSETAATLPLKAYRRLADGDREPFNGRLSRLLDGPSPGNTQANLVGQLVGCLALRGSAPLGKFRGETREIEQLALLPPDRVRVELLGGEPRYIITNDRGEQTVHTSRDVLFVKGPLSVDGVTGVSPIAQAREALGLAAALEQYASGLYGNSAAPLGVLTIPANHPNADELMERLRDGFEARHRGSEKAGRVAVLSGEVTFSPISLSPSDAEFIASRHLSTQEIARLFRVPAHLLNAPTNDSMTYANVEQVSIDFIRYSLAPWLTVIEQAITSDPDLSPEPVFCEFNFEGFLRGSSAERAAFYKSALDPSTGWLRRDEVRRLENLPPEPIPATPEVPSEV